MDRPERILVIRLSSLGDILHALPAVAALRASFPTARIDWLAEERMRFLVSSAADADEVVTVNLSLPKQRPLAVRSWRPLWQTLRQLRRRRYDVAIDFQGLAKTALLGLASGARRRVGFAPSLVRERPAHWFYTSRVEPAPGVKHVVALNRLLARAAGAGENGAALRLSVPPECEQEAERALAPIGNAAFVILNPGGGWPTKRWPAERFAGLARMILARLGMEVMITTGPGEEELWHRICAAVPGRIHHGDVSFLGLVPLVRRASLMVAGDTGPYHLACALGTPTVGIFGPTDPERNGPWSARDVSVVRRLACSFCYGRSCPKAAECMDIPVEEVYQAVVRRLEVES